MITILVILSSLWVYYDATKHKIGKIPDSRSIINNSAGVWAICVALLWIVAFPLYLYKRKTLLELAKNNPQEVRGRNIKLLLLVMLLVFAIFGLLTLNPAISA